MVLYLTLHLQRDFGGGGGSQQNALKSPERTPFFRPRLHERFFACDGDAIFLKIVASPARGENRMCSHPRTGDATDEKIAEKKSREIQ